jgi:hypothetical protein
MTLSLLAQGRDCTRFFCGRDRGALDAGQTTHRHIDDDNGKCRMSYNVTEPGRPTLRLSPYSNPEDLASPIEFIER